MTIPDTEQAVAAIIVTRGDGTTCTTQVADSEVATDPLAQAAAMASALVRLRPEMTVSVTGNDAARHQHARQRDMFWFLGQKPGTCPKDYRGDADGDLLRWRAGQDRGLAGPPRTPVEIPGGFWSFGWKVGNQLMRWKEPRQRFHADFPLTEVTGASPITR